MSNDELLDEITLLKAKILYLEGRIGAVEMATKRLVSHDDYDRPAFKTDLDLHEEMEFLRKGKPYENKRPANRVR